ncbi:WbqC family protein [Streptomyces niveus]|uniref:WbqC family protein n=1 Tax=Streptomyces niveus TaxID=193462 RepID=UPI003868C6F6|nr:WbqC family protein [Streptomyces niveus]
MPLTSASCAPASTAGSSAPDPAIARTAHPERLCAIHQPNLFPRLSTLAKLYAADVWVVLDDVQFARRDYQHRTCLAALDDPARRQWLSLATHLPQGRSTVIRDARLADPAGCRRRTAGMIRQYYGRSRHWPSIQEIVEPVLDRFTTTDRLADITETSTRSMLKALGWQGTILHSSTLAVRAGRSNRLADLALATGSTAYLCGTGGMRYLDPVPFEEHAVEVVPFHSPVDTGMPLWDSARKVGALWAVAGFEPDGLADALRSQQASALS